jgi:hypothetical protein
VFNVKAWLAAAGEPVEETAYIPDDASELPYILYSDYVTRLGGDVRNLGYSHSVTVERYSDVRDDNPALEQLFDDKALKYEKDRVWLSEEECFMTIYQFEFLESEVI